MTTCTTCEQPTPSLGKRTRCADCTREVRDMAHTRAKRKRSARDLPKGHRACAWCGLVKVFAAGIRYCSPACGGRGAAIATDEAAILARAKRASEAATRAREQDVLARVAGMTPVEAYRLGVKHGHAKGYASAAYRVSRDEKQAARAAG